MTQARMTAWVSGRVQGVGFRWWARSRALELGLRGSASNLADGRVEVVAEGGEQACEQLCLLLEVHPVDGRPGTVTALSVRWSQPKGLLPGFVER